MGGKPLQGVEPRRRIPAATPIGKDKNPSESGQEVFLRQEALRYHGQGSSSPSAADRGRQSPGAQHDDTLAVSAEGREPFVRLVFKTGQNRGPPCQRLHSPVLRTSSPKACLKPLSPSLVKVKVRGRSARRNQCCRR